jgi:hypothetical protein
LPGMLIRLSAAITCGRGIFLARLGNGCPCAGRNFLVRDGATVSLDHRNGRSFS